jgi:hypothetical protein
VEGNNLSSVAKNIRNQSKNKKKRNNDNEGEEQQSVNSKHVKIDDAEITEGSDIKVTQ